MEEIVRNRLAQEITEMRNLIDPNYVDRGVVDDTSDSHINDWFTTEPTEEEYKRFKRLMAAFVTQLNINNRLVDGERSFPKAGTRKSREIMNPWNVYNGFELSCRLGPGYQLIQDNANYLNYAWVNINPHFDKITKEVISVKVNVKPDMDVLYCGKDYLIADLDLNSENEPNNHLKQLFNELRLHIAKWNEGDYLSTEDNDNETDYLELSPISYTTNFESRFSRNRILFGAPGTGKSYQLELDKKELIGTSGYFERVTFHPDYTNANFVGTYKPIPDGANGITYKYVPGPFMRVYVEALKSARLGESKPFLLIIEEINRANVAGVFGDIFQLLDRKNNISEYPIQTSVDVRNYLVDELGGTPEDYPNLIIPDNMFIWATMNSADQGVFPMDTAFKRRWDFTYLGINKNEDGIKEYTFNLASGSTNWNELRKAINNRLSSLKINEDKLLGPYFISEEVLKAGDDAFIETFKNKVIMYLFEDAAKQRRKDLFVGQDSRYSDICASFDAIGVEIFNGLDDLEDID